MHVLIIGMTDSGKSTLAKALCRSYRARGIGTLVLDPTRANDWGADYQTHDVEAFLAMYWARETEYCMAFFDESGVSIGQHNRDAQAPATMGRKKGHLNHFIVQRLTQISPNVRGMCSEVYLFRCSRSDARTLADEFNCEELGEAGSLAMPNDGTGRGAEYFHLRSGGKCERRNLFRSKANASISVDRSRGGDGVHGSENARTETGGTGAASEPAATAATAPAATPGSVK